MTLAHTIDDDTDSFVHHTVISTMSSASHSVDLGPDGCTEAATEAELLRLAEGSAARVGLGPLEALALHLVVLELLAVVRGLSWRARACVVEREVFSAEASDSPAVARSPKARRLAVEITLSVELPSELRADGSALEEGLRRAAMRLPSRVGGVVEHQGGRLDVRLSATRAGSGGLGSRAASAPADAPEAALRIRAAAALEELERVEAELARVRAELEDASGGAMAARAAFEACERELEQERRRKDELMDVLAHELRNPLATLQLAANDGDRGRMSDRGQDIVRRQTEHLRRMVDDLLEASRLTHGRVELRRTRLDVRRVVERAVARAIEQAPDPTAAERLELVLPDEPAWAPCDGPRIEQAVLHLLENALKYTGPLGRVHVTVSDTPAHVDIAVRDTGRGMTEAERDQAFELFTQHRQGLARVDGGLGLGLAVVREIVSLHGGTVKAMSEGRGHGSTFQVRLPREGDALERVDPEHPVDVLLVEDHDDLRELLAARLRRRGCRVEEASSGADALEQLQRGPAIPDVVVTDVGLPGLDGYALARAIRGDPRLEHLRLVALTGYGGQEATARTREAGFDAHLVKPVRLEVLLDALVHSP